MTWSPDGTRWLVDDRPWEDDLRWDQVVSFAAKIKLGRRHRLVPPPVCRACGDDGMLASHVDGRWFTVPCEVCEPDAYRAWVADAEGDRGLALAEWSRGA